jgi:hypothetical protein
MANLITRRKKLLIVCQVDPYDEITVYSFNKLT